MPVRTTRVAPSAGRLTHSLRDIGYSFESAIADLVDNSIAVGATSVEIQIQFSGPDSRVLISDNGHGMDDDGITEALRFGSNRSYETGELGRYGLGLKTASLSQCRKISVFSRSKTTGVLVSRCLNLDFIQQVNDWVILDADDSEALEQVHQLLQGPHGSVVVWEDLDRLLPANNPNSTWARRKFESLATRLKAHLETVFHRFLAGEGVDKTIIKINGQELQPWDPFARTEKHTELISDDSFEISTKTGSGNIGVRAYCLPAKTQFSSQEAFDNAAGIRKWNRQQGLYIYRANRLVQWGGWDQMRTLDEHTKLARVALDFDTDLDDEFNINVAKMRVTIPQQLKKLMARCIGDVCARADSRYRKDQNKNGADKREEEESTPEGFARGAEVGLALKSAAARSGNYAAFKAIAELIRQDDPELAKLLGL